MSDEDKDRRDELLAVAATLMSGWCNDGTVSDRFIAEVVNVSDRLIRAVDKFTWARAKTEGDQ